MKKICYLMLILFINQTAMVAQGPRNSSDEKVHQPETILLRLLNLK